MERNLTSATMLASPNQASQIFRIDGSSPVNLKNLFVVRFMKRSTNTSPLTFLAKSVERPSVQPTVEEINQYNKKRIIQTGVKYNPISCSLYDTADSAAQAMWIEYSKYYFGDYNQPTASYRDDIINETMLGNQEGYGIQIRQTSSSDLQGINSQFFFDGIEVYHVWGGEFTSYRLLNPKIASFTPDELDYEQNAVSMITLSLHYEGIFHENEGKPMSIASGNSLSASFLRDAFGTKFSGQVYDPVGSEPSNRRTSFVSVPSLASRNPSTATLPKLKVAEKTDVVQNTSLGGAISRYGNFNFGNVTAIDTNIQTNSQDLSRALLGSSLANVPDIAFSIENNSDDFSDVVSNPFDIRTNATYEINGVEVNPPAPVDAKVVSVEEDRRRILLSERAISAVNNRSDGTSQIGYRTAGYTEKVMVKEPVPAYLLSPSLVFGPLNSSIRISVNISGSIIS